MAFLCGGFSTKAAQVASLSLSESLFVLWLYPTLVSAMAVRQAENISPVAASERQLDATSVSSEAPASNKIETEAGKTRSNNYFATGLHTSMWQETPFGMIIHWATGGKVFK